MDTWPTATVLTLVPADGGSVGAFRGDQTHRLSTPMINKPPASTSQPAGASRRGGIAGDAGEAGVGWSLNSSCSARSRHNKC
jgi:hypothetical protein